MLSSALLLALLAAVTAYPHGPPIEACGDMFPSLHNVTAKTSKAPFSITLSSTSYSANDVITIMVRANHDTKPDYYYEGLFLQMRRACGDSQDEQIGTFSFDRVAYNNTLQTLACGGRAGSALAQMSKAHYTNHTVTWTAPADVTGHLRIRATMVHETDEFWINVYSDNNLNATTGVACPSRSAGSAFIASLSLLCLGLASMFF